MFLWLVGGCASRYALEPPPQNTPAVLVSYVKILEVDRAEPIDPYRLEIVAGQHTLTAEYATFSGRWLCNFEFEAKPGANYELIDRENPHPVVLVRLERFNALISNRYEPVLPESCIEQDPAKR